jgi:hypothetical protein
MRSYFYLVFSEEIFVGILKNFKGWDFRLLISLSEETLKSKTLPFFFFCFSQEI